MRAIYRLLPPILPHWFWSRASRRVFGSNRKISKKWPRTIPSAVEGQSRDYTLRDNRRFCPLRHHRHCMKWTLSLSLSLSAALHCCEVELACVWQSCLCRVHIGRRVADSESRAAKYSSRSSLRWVLGSPGFANGRQEGQEGVRRARSR